MLLIALVALLLVVRLLWGHFTSRALRAQVDEIRRRGEPIAMTDLPLIEVLDSENAAKFQMDAARAIAMNVDSPRASNLSFPDYPPYSDKWVAMCDASEKANGKLFALAREARRHTKVQWPQPAERTGQAKVTTILPLLNGMRGVANVLADGAHYANVMGNDVDAIERVRDLLHVARSLRQDETIIGQLVAVGIDAVACNVTEIIAPGLRVDASSAASAPANRAAAQALVADLLDETTMQRGFERSFIFERVYLNEVRPIEAKGTWVVRPLVDAQLVRDNRNFDIQIASSRLANKPQVMAALAKATIEGPYGDTRAIVPGVNDVPRYSRWFGTASYRERLFETRFRVIGERRIAATSVAAQLFRVDHSRWPERLEELVPAYLSGVPLDPFTDGEPLGYTIRRGALPDGSDRPLVFMRAGEADLGPYPEPSYGWEQDRRTRGLGVKAQDLHQYRDLTRFVPPAPPASTQAVEDEPQETQAPGE